MILYDFIASLLVVKFGRLAIDLLRAEFVFGAVNDHIHILRNPIWPCMLIGLKSGR